MRFDPGRGPGADFEPIWPPLPRPLSHVAPLRFAPPRSYKEGRREGDCPDVRPPRAHVRTQARPIGPTCTGDGPKKSVLLMVQHLDCIGDALAMLHGNILIALHCMALNRQNSYRAQPLIN
eukprot:1843711-Pyramimonas_sp.AAC.1